MVNRPGPFVVKSGGGGGAAVFAADNELLALTKEADAAPLAHVLNCYPDAVKALDGVREYAQAQIDSYHAEHQTLEELRKIDKWVAVIKAIEKVEAKP